MNLNVNFDIILKRPLSHRIIILAVINVIIAGAIYYFVTGPKYDEVAKLTVKLEGISAQLSESRTIAADIEKYRRESADLQRRLDEALAQLPNEKEIPDLIDAISDAVKDVGLKIFLFKPLPERRKGFYAEVPVSMRVQGGYESLYEFADRISKLSRIVNIESISVNKVGQSGSIPILGAEFIVTTFRFIPTAQVPGPRR